MVDVEGNKEPVRITYTDKFDGLPVFSPDGKKLVWTTSRTANGKAQLFIAEWNEKNARKALEASPQRVLGDETKFTEKIEIAELTSKLTYIASDDLEGRMTGSDGIRLAAEYISGIFEKFHLKYLGRHESFLWPFDFVSAVKIEPEKNKMILEKKEYSFGEDFMVFPSSESKGIEAEVVFAGYGLKISDGGDFEYNSYNSVDVKDKIVMVLNDIPQDLDEEREKLFERSIASGYKQMLARQQGAVAILEVVPELVDNSNEIVGTSGIVSLQVSEKFADIILEGKNLTVKELKEKFAGGDPDGNKHLFNTGLIVEIRSDVERVISQDDNVVGVVYSDNPDAGYIFIGAHYDHLGFGETNSRSMGEDKHKIHNGADDNGSGTVTVVELAEYYAGLKKSDPESITYNLVFCLWSGEELGLIGSNAFAKDLPVPSEKVKAYLNFDMVGRMDNNKLEMQGTGSATEWKGILERKNVVSGFDLNLVSDPFLPTDATSFYLKGIPTLSFFTGV
ncbi:MAG: M28 family peptidase, partial [Bacteroidales bacterium]|nr:M28 family peptidase [Bacteroidales bacterium]